jgi:hypothetical protein
MKKIFILCFICCSVLFLACSSSQFTTSARHSRNGKVSYTNRPLHEKRISLKRFTTGRSNNKGTKLVDNASAESLIIPTNAGTIEKITGVKKDFGECLIASTSNEPVLRLIENSATRTVRSSHNISQTKPEKGEMVEELYTPQASSKPAHRVTSSDSRRVEPIGLAGFVLSILGLIPFIGILFSLLGIIFSGIGLHRANKDPGRFKGSGFAIAGIIIGSLALIANAIFSITYILEHMFDGISIGAF